MTYEQDRLAQNHPARRPDSHEGLLFHPIADDPTIDGATSYQDWEFDHGTTRRFRVGGLFWFHKVTRMTMQDLSAYSETARTEVENTNWPEMPNSGNHWTAPVARKQFLEANQRGALYFQKAALVILSCELALQAMIDKGTAKIDGIASGSEVYRHMSIIPSVWNINDFNEKYLNSLQVEQRESLSSVGDQNSAALIRDMATGYTCTYASASAIKQATDNFANKTSNVRARPGRRVLGRQRASEHEHVDIG